VAGDMAESFIFFLNCFVTLLSILDPIGGAATLLALTAGDTPECRRLQVLRIAKTVAAVLLVFAVAGGAIFALFGISTQALMVAGGLILIHMSFKMLEGQSLTYRSSRPEREEALKKEDIAIIPMAIPLLAGPASITAVIVFANRADGLTDWAMLLAAIALAVWITRLILLQSDRIAGWLGETGMRLLVRIMGLVLLAMGVEFILSAVKIYFA